MENYNDDLSTMTMLKLLQLVWMPQLHKLFVDVVMHLGDFLFALGSTCFSHVFDEDFGSFLKEAGRITYSGKIVSFANRKVEQWSKTRWDAKLLLKLPSFASTTADSLELQKP
ncbi:hypothetical protein F0562_018696 [Nyssa sinensis]|uniref:Uncharacterized protein n=1 Tax=Nyssa sinensis TaxID=561372 RepID=A0A5J4ZA75_9ASTE|nr:hypothetical protein F0562_018696 [Nyssa sinensis]